MTSAAETPPSRMTAVRQGSVVVALGLATMLGANALAFLCDDAFITFRYVANAHAGHGLVWNAPPFAPVEGYTGFSWALLLWAVWSWCGIEPPAAANVLSMVFGFAQFGVVGWAALRVRDRDGHRLPAALGLLTLAVVVGNRTFLQWMTSGLETALFNLGFVGWVLSAFRRDTDTTRWFAVWSGAAALTAWTRPDGLLLVAATAGVGVFALLRRQRSLAATCVGALPLAGVAAHVVWRRSFYGEWLPNTYYAKVVDAWPEAGWRYLACFALENGTWLVPCIALAWLAVELVRGPRAVARWPVERTAAVAAVGCVLFHAGYYVFRVGGDHFEYRVLSQLVPLSALSVAAMVARLGRGIALPMLAVGVLGLASTAGWAHYALTRDMPAHGFQPIADRLPAAVAPLARWYDRQQAWLLFHFIGLRCDKHRLVLERFQANHPSCMWVGPRPDDIPVAAIHAVGVAGWSLPDTAVLDLYGLNDWVVARTPVAPPVAPGMAASERRARLHEFVTAADADGDGRLEERELRAVFAGISATSVGDERVEFLLAVARTLFGSSAEWVLSRDEAEQMGWMMIDCQLMAHERRPPPGYVEDFAPDVEVVHGALVVTPRPRPLTAERVRELERTWRQRVTAR